MFFHSMEFVLSVPIVSLDRARVEERFWAERVFGRPSAKVKASRCEFEVIFLRNKATMCHGINKLTKKQAENKANFGPFEAVLERFLAIQSQLGSGR